MHAAEYLGWDVSELRPVSPVVAPLHQFCQLTSFSYDDNLTLLLKAEKPVWRSNDNGEIPAGSQGHDDRHRCWQQRYCFSGGVGGGRHEQRPPAGPTRPEGERRKRFSSSCQRLAGLCLLFIISWDFFTYGTQARLSARMSSPTCECSSVLLFFFLTFTHMMALTKRIKTEDNKWAFGYGWKWLMSAQHIFFRTAVPGTVINQKPEGTYLI